ncbi:MAG: hypothetical protein U7126_29285 [Microcoleus sp.]
MSSTIDRGRETALPCPLYHSGAAGIDITARRNGKKPGFFLDAGVVRNQYGSDKTDPP